MGPAAAAAPQWRGNGAHQFGRRPSPSLANYVAPRIRGPRFRMLQGNSKMKRGVFIVSPFFFFFLIPYNNPVFIIIFSSLFSNFILGVTRFIEPKI